MDILLGIAIGFAVALLLSAGAGINFGLTRYRYRKRMCNIVSAQDHRNEGRRLIKKSIYTLDRANKNYLRQAAFLHFCVADQIDNGPYKS